MVSARTQLTSSDKLLRSFSEFSPGVNLMWHSQTFISNNRIDPSWPPNFVLAIVDGSQREWGRIYSKSSVFFFYEFCNYNNSSTNSEVNPKHTEEGYDEMPAFHLDFHNSESSPSCYTCHLPLAIATTSHNPAATRWALRTQVANVSAKMWEEIL